MRTTEFYQGYAVELLYRQPPPLKSAELLNALRRRCPGVAMREGSEKRGQFAFVHLPYVNEPGSAGTAPQTVIVAGEGPSREGIASALEYSRRFPSAHRIVEQCSRTVVVSDTGTGKLSYRERLDLFTRALICILEHAPPEAIHWLPSEQLLNPFAYLRASRESRGVQLLAGA